MSKWVTDSFKKGEKPTIYNLKSDLIKLTVHRWVGLEGWFYSCRELDIDRAECLKNYCVGYWDTKSY